MGCVSLLLFDAWYLASWLSVHVVLSCCPLWMWRSRLCPCVHVCVPERLVASVRLTVLLSGPSGVMDCRVLFFLLCIVRPIVTGVEYRAVLPADDYLRIPSMRI